MSTNEAERRKRDLGFLRPMKLFYRYVLFAFIPIIVIGTVSTWLSKRWDDALTRQQIEAYRKQRVEYHAQHIHDYFQSKVALVKSIAAVPTIETGEIQSILPFLRDLEAELKDTFEGVYFSLPDGTVFSQTGKTFSVRDRYYFPRYQKQEPIISKVMTSLDTGRQIVLVWVPAYNSAGKWIGGVGATILIEQLVSHISDIGVGDEGFSLLVDEDGVVLSKKPFTGADELAEKLQRISKDESLFRETTLNGESSFVAFRRISPIGWTVALVQPKRDAVKGFPRFREMNFIVLGFCALLALVLAERYSQRVLRDEEEKRRELEQRLLFSEKMEALGVLAGGVAHDFNNILGSIYGFTELAARKLAPDSDASTYLAHVLSGCHRGRDLVDRILTFSRRREPVFESVDLAEVVVEARTFVGSSLPATVQVELENRIENAWVRGDRTQLFQVVVNLCTNAGYAMRERGGRVLIALDETQPGADVLPAAPPPLGYLCLSVRDSGVGIPSDQQKRIFEPFFTTKPVGQGSGLGLSVVHAIVQAHEGHITFDSQVGQGTNFRIFLPCAEPKVKPVESRERQPNAVTSGGRILVVDDDRALLRVARLMLESAGYQVEEADGPRRALEVLNANGFGFDLVMTDHSMPEISGMELSEKILEKAPGMKIILCTGYAAGVDEKVCLDKGVHALLAKPYSRDQLIELVARFISKPRAGV